MPLKDYILGRTNRIVIGSATAVGLIIAGAAGLASRTPAFLVHDSNGQNTWGVDIAGRETASGAYANKTLTAASCDVKATSTGQLICGTDATGAGGVSTVGEGLSLISGLLTRIRTITGSSLKVSGTLSGSNLVVSGRAGCTFTGTSATGALVCNNTVGDTEMVAEDYGDFTNAGGPDGFTIDANAVALGTDTTGNYVLDVADGTGIDGTAAAEGATYTPTFDSTELDALSWSNGANATNAWTFDVSGTDHTMTAGSGLMSFSHDIAVLGDNIEATTETDRFVWMANGSTYAPEAITLGTDTTGTYAAGDAEAGAALTGDSATSFFSTGTLELGIGGTGFASCTDGGFVTGNGAAALTCNAILSDNQIYIGDGTTEPTATALPECTSTEKIQYTDAGNGLTCVGDQDSGAGALRTSTGSLHELFKNRFVNVAGDTMSGGLLIVNGGNGTLPTISAGLLLEIAGTASGKTLHAETALSSSGQLIVEEGPLVFTSNTSNDAVFHLLSTGDFEIFDGSSRVFDVVGESGTVTVNSSQTTTADFIVNGDVTPNLLYIDVSTEFIGILTGGVPQTALEVAGTASGRILHAQDSVQSSGSILATGPLKVKGVMSGYTLVIGGATTLNNVAYTWPKQDGTASGRVLATNGAGVLTWTAVSAASTKPIDEECWDAADMKATTTSFAPLETLSGAVAQVRTYVRSFDDTVPEYAAGKFQVPGEINTSGTVTFRAYIMAKTGAASKNVQLRFGHYSPNDSASYTGAFTNEDSGDKAIDATQDDLTEATWTETVSNLSWAANDLVYFRLGRIDASANDLSGDMYLHHFCVEIPRT